MAKPFVDIERESTFRVSFLHCTVLICFLDVYQQLLSLCLSSRLRKDDESLTIPNVNEGDEGMYTCTVKSEIDQDTASARLTVLGTLTYRSVLEQGLLRAQSVP